MIFFDWGGVVFYIKDNLYFKVCFDLLFVIEDFEILWIEIYNYFYFNLFCGIIYCYFNSNFGNFVDYLNFVIDKISREFKFCII